MPNKLRLFLAASVAAVFAWGCSSDAAVSAPVEGEIAPSLEPAVVAGLLPNRSYADRPDDVSGAQLHAVYVIASDGVDRRLDEQLPLHWSIETGVNWLAAATGGLTFRLDTYRGMPDITFLRLPETGAQLMDADVRGAIERALKLKGRFDPNKLYIAYYDGDHNRTCGGASWPPRLPGNTAAMYLQGQQGDCVNPFVAQRGGTPRYWEMAAIHDMLHVLGIVSPDSPHHTEAYPAHVPDAGDLMYAGTGPWTINALTVDVGGDDYYGSSIVGGVDLAASRFMVRLPSSLVSSLAAPSLMAAPVVAKHMPHEAF